MNEKTFKEKIIERIQKTALNILKLSFLTWVIGLILIAKKVIPCNNIVEFGIFSASLICSTAIYKRFK